MYRNAKHLTNPILVSQVIDLDGNFVRSLSPHEIELPPYPLMEDRTEAETKNARQHRAFNSVIRLEVEIVFAIPGLGDTFVTSVTTRDYNLLVGVTVLYSVFLVAFNALVDVVYTWLDPRIRF